MTNLHKNMEHLLHEQFEVDYFDTFHILPLEGDFEEYKEFFTDASMISSQGANLFYDDTIISSLDWTASLKEKHLRSLHWKNQLKGDFVDY